MAGSTFTSSVINMCKICVGTGILALPYSFACGGLLTAPIFLALIAGWNSFAVDRLLECEVLLPAVPMSPGCSQGGEQCCSLGDVAKGAFGRSGRYMVDATIATLLVGVCISYQVAASSFMLSDPALSFGSSSSNSASLFPILLLLSLFSKIASLSKFSFLGLIAIAFSFIVIIYHGLNEFHFAGFTTPTVSFFPASIGSLAVYYGTACFSFGITPVTFPIKSSMAEPRLMTKANRVALLLTFLFYTFVSLFVVMLYSPPGVEPLKGDILQALPTGSPLTLAVRVCMIIVCLVSYPLCLVPGSEVIEDMLLDSYLQPFIPNQSTLRLVTRSVLVVLTTVVAAKIPSFVLVVSLIGCFCVGVVSFVFPPLFHMRLLQKKYGTESGAPGAKVAVSEASFLLPKSQSADLDAAFMEALRQKAFKKMRVDTIMIVVGIVSTLFTTFLTLQTIVKQWDSNGEVAGEVLHGFAVNDGPE